MLKKLKLRFVITTMLIVSIMLGVIFGLFYHVTKLNLEQSSITMMESIAHNPFQMAPPGAAGEDMQLPYFSLQVTEDGELLSSGGGYYDLSDEELIRDLIDAAFATEDTVGVLEAYKLRFYKVEENSFRLLIFSDISSELLTLHNLLRNCALIGVLSFLLFLALSIFLAEWTVRPVAAAWQQQKQFVADASHELKTPLTVISTNAEILLNDAYDQTAKDQCAGVIRAMSVRMRGLVEELLDLARADRGRSDMLMERLDLSELLKNAVLPFEPLFYEQGLSFTTGIQPRIYVKGSAAHLEQVSTILLDNAAKYALPGIPVYLKLWTVNRKRCRLMVSNGSAPLKDDELKNIFKRFYRLDESRAGDGSYGLGLSIAETIVSAHKGRIWATCQGDTIQFQVELPLCR